MGLTDGNGYKINVLSTKFNCGLQINRYEKVKVSFNFKETEGLAVYPQVLSKKQKFHNLPFLSKTQFQYYHLGNGQFFSQLPSHQWKWSEPIPVH